MGAPRWHPHSLFFAISLYLIIITVYVQHDVLKDIYGIYLHPTSYIYSIYFWFFGERGVSTRKRESTSIRANAARAPTPASVARIGLLFERIILKIIIFNFFFNFIIYFYNTNYHDKVYNDVLTRTSTTRIYY